MSAYRYVLQGCNEANIAAVNEVALAGLPGIQLHIEKSEAGYYFISVDSEANNDKVLDLIKDAFAPLLLTVAVVMEWPPSNFSKLS